MNLKKLLLAAGGVALLGAVFVATPTASADSVSVVSAPHIERFTGDVLDGTDTYSSFHCEDSDVLFSAVAYRQTGSGPVTPLAVLDYTANTYPEGAVVWMKNDSGQDEGYRVTLICGQSVEN